MEFIPICLECKNFNNDDKCKFFKQIPHGIKNRETMCIYFTGGKYTLYSADSKPGDGEKINRGVTNHGKKTGRNDRKRKRV